MVVVHSKFTSINSRLRILSIFSLLIFLLTTVVVFLLLARLQDNVDQLIGNRFEQALDNSQNRSDFGVLVARLGVFRATFYGNRDLVATEGRALEAFIEQLAGQVRDHEQRHLLYQLQEEYQHFLHRAYWINYTFLQRRWQEEGLDDLLIFNSEGLMRQIMAGSVDDTVMKTFVELRQLRVGFQQVLTMFLSVDRTYEQIFLPLDQRAILAQLEPIKAIAGKFSARDFPANLFGRELLGRIDHMAYLLHQHQRDIALLSEQGQRLNLLTERITAAMQDLDLQASGAVRTARQEISTTLRQVFAGALAVCFVLIGAVLGSHRWLFIRHVQQPMGQVGERLRAFQEGDRSTPMRLERSDEWDQIESVFNDMLGSLEKSFVSVRDSESRYREIFTNATEGIYRASLDGRFLALNPAAVAMLGHTTEAEALAYYDDLENQLYVNPQDRRRLLRLLYDHGASKDFEVPAKRKDGQFFWMALNNHLVYSDNKEPLFIEGTMQDISLRKTTEESLNQLKNFLQRIIDSMPSILIAVDAELKITLWNRRAEQECRLSSSHARGIALKDALQLIKYKTILTALQTALASQKPVRLQQVEGYGQDRSKAKRHYNILIYPLPSSQDGGAVIHMDDVTEQVALEQILIQKEKIESVAGLAAGFAHELNNPLAVILQTVQVLQRRLSPEFSKNCETAEQLGTSMKAIAAYLHEKKCDIMFGSIAEAGTRAAKIVENIQTFSRSSGSDFSRHALDDLVERTLDLAVSDYDMRRQLKFQRIAIVRNYHSIPEVVCDAGQIQQVILILLKNAAQALVNVDADPQITLRLEAKGSYVCLEVRDNGTGMSPEVCRRVFDPFYSTQEVGRGVGLGLSIAYHIITQNHRGFMSVSSESGSGSSFEVCLPTLNEN
ncbi:ATP-binding protein [Pelovirga terrestris]|uniref:histidine kinase n=1 Tax=Pelovirga terrestris TaxID=2771352 RepID=A0A8J6UQW2_9BACT|nr:ATP-binding protein [Pelovirga terrestris]MBD1399811.1 PAS domain S-box protein [Pelovirga terrestris]